MKYEVWIDISGVYRLEGEGETREEAIDHARAQARDLVKNNHAINYEVVDVNKVKF